MLSSNVLYGPKIGKKILRMLNTVSKALFSKGLSSFTSATQIFPAVNKVMEKFTQQSLDLYKQNKVDVDKELDKVCAL